jgi:diaminohydroxyphosphoribosylaminopyrimidine deaminase/5-amino-6-(5-phosphoribosylamino)uracil reductase
LEGGGKLAASFLAAGLVDRVAWFQASHIIGGDGLAAIGDLHVDAVTESPAFLFREVRAVGEDVLTRFDRQD